MSDKRFILIIAILACLYLFTRLFHLTTLPIFFDEANYLMWAKRIAVDNSHLFISFTSGKAFPLIWLVALLLKIFPADLYLLAGRLTSTFFGAISIIAVYNLTRLWFHSTKTALLAVFLALFTPFLLFHDRMLLYDSQLAAMMTMSAYLASKTAITYKRSDAIWWGVFLGLAFLSKSPAILYLWTTPLVFLAQSKKLFSKTTVTLTLLAMLVSQLIANINIVSSGYLEYIRKSLDYTPGTKLASQAFGSLLLPNLWQSIHWLTSYLTLPFFVFSLIGTALLLLKRRRIGVSICLLAIVPVLAFSLAARIYFPRYIVFVAPYFVISIAYVLIQLSKISKPACLIITLILLYLPFEFAHALLFNPPQAKFPAADKVQYITGFPSGYGFAEIFDYLHKDSEHHTLCIIIEGSYSHYPNAFWLEFWDNKNIYIEERWPLTKHDIVENQCFTDRGLALQPIIFRTKPDQPISKTYFIVKDDRNSGIFNAPELYGLKTVVKAEKPEGNNAVYLGEKK